MSASNFAFTSCRVFVGSSTPCDSFRSFDSMSSRILMPSTSSALKTPAMSMFAMEWNHMAMPRRSWSESSQKRPQSRSTALAPPLAALSSRMRTLPAWGSRCTRPSLKNMMPKAFTSSSRIARLSRPCSLQKSLSCRFMMGVASMNSMTSTCWPQRFSCMVGTTTLLPAACRTSLACEAARHSSLKSSSFESMARISSIMSTKSSSLCSALIRCAIQQRVSASSQQRRSTPSCCTFTATTSPLPRSRALCTCAIDAEPMGSGSNSTKIVSKEHPRFFRIIRETSSRGLIGMCSVSSVNSWM
mmetsp:Transcript_8573/g.26645  ORF Transcript_8573/g.26645 Transcript_8573/m.26645 type:complete len:301 (-) Transcript_8573:434-1336(-)